MQRTFAGRQPSVARGRGAAAVAAVALFVFFIGAPAATAQETDPHLEALIAQAEEIRGLPFLRPVKIERRSEDDLRAYMEMAFERDVPHEETALAEALLKQWSLLEEGLDLRAVYLEILAENVAGFYDPKDGTLWIIGRDGDGDGAAGAGQDDLVIVHELIHALEDQHFDLEALDEGAKGNDDRALALSLLVEGSATYGMFQPMVGQLEGRGRRLALRGIGLTFDLGEVLEPGRTGRPDRPDFLMSSLIAPYREGLRFASTIAEAEGFEALTRAYANPPRSTEQLLHPEKYLDGGDEPVERRLPDLAPALGAEWRVLGQNTMGELQMRILMESWLLVQPAAPLLEQIPPGLRPLAKAGVKLGGRLLPSRDPARAVRGWGGDRYQVLHHATGRTAVVWWTAWDDEAAARRFEEAYRAARGGRRDVAVTRSGLEVVALEGVPEEAREAVLGALRPQAF